jgi:chaperone modulatory protein CbpM
MITIETLCLRVQRISPPELEEWVARSWIRPDGEPGAYRFQPIDEARVRLILELRHDLRINDEALPVVLSLLDQLYAGRRHMRRVRDAIRRGQEQGLRETLSRLLDEDVQET